MAATKQAREIPQNIDEEYYQISTEILSSFPKYRPPVDLFTFRDDIGVLAPYSTKGARLSNEQVEEVAQLCSDGGLFVSRSDHPIYSRHIVKQLDLVLQDNNLKEAEIADICIRAMLMRYTDFNDQPVKAVFELLYRDVMVVTEYLWQDKHHINAFVRRLFRQHSPGRHAINTLSLGLWLWMQMVSDYRRKDLDRLALALLLHDAGMCKVPPFLLQKPGPLKAEEREKVLMHPLLGVKIMQKLEITFEELLRACFEHHERMDGSGYPQHLKGPQISRAGRLTAVADSFSAMICQRAYAPAKEPLE
ncbi:MAG: HD domain-containing protein, partial [Desulfovibrionaceae bacterium]|nr:HD domain-containing protein [Desulfovibrionaceae bacterium]